MKQLTKGIYFVKEEKRVRIWHDCTEYKDRDSARVELESTGKGTKDALDFICPVCGFTYTLDRNLNLG
jgi:hypothetical protein